MAYSSTHSVRVEKLRDILKKPKRLSASVPMVIAVPRINTNGRI